MGLTDLETLTSCRWVSALNKTLQSRRQLIIEDKFIPIKDDIAFPWTLQHLMASEELINVIDKPRGSAAEWWNLYDRAADEVQRGASMRMGMVSIVSQKPPLSKL